MVSSKFLYDDGEEDEVFMDEWAKSGNITIPELVKMEKNFLAAIVRISFLYKNIYNFYNNIICFLRV